MTRNARQSNAWEIHKALQGTARVIRKASHRLTRLIGKASLLTSAFLLCIAAQAFAQKPDAGGMHAPTAQLERGRTVFVTSSCHFCHGVDLTQTSMGAANLLRSGIVAADVNGNILWPFVKAGLPALQTSMPSYYDMTQQQGTDMAAYVHYLRQMGRYRELMSAQLPPGNAADGKATFNKQGSCATCHTTESLGPVVKAKTPSALKEDLLQPAVARPSEGVAQSAAAAAHEKFTENASPTEVANLLGYLHDLQ